MFSVQEHQVIATDYKQIPYHPKHLPVFFCDINHRLMDSCPIISSHSLHTWFPIHHSLLFGGRVGIRREMLSQEMEKLTVKGCTSSSSSLKKAYKRQELWITYFLIWIGNEACSFVTSETKENPMEAEHWIWISFASFYAYYYEVVVVDASSEGKSQIHNKQRKIIFPCLLLLSCWVVPFFLALWTVVIQAPLSVRFSRQEYWSGFPFPSPGDLPDSGTEPVSPALAGRFFTTKPPGKPFPWLYLSKDNFFLTSILTYTEKYFVASLNLSGALEGFGAVLHLTASRSLLETFSVLTQH